MDRHGDALGELYAALIRRVDQLADRLVAAIDDQESGYRAVGSVPAADLRCSCRDNILTVLQQLADSTPAGLDPFDAPRATGRRRAEQRLPLDTLLHSFRIGGRVIWDELAGEARRTGPEATDAVLDGATAVWEVVDRVSSEVAAAYRATEQQMVQADAARTRVVLEGLLAGRGREPGMAAEAARVLGLPTSGGFAVVVAAEPDGGDALLPDARQILHSQGMRSAWHRWPEQLVGVVALGGRGIEPLRDVLRGFSNERIGVSAEIDVLADVQEGHLQAGTALATLPLGRTGAVLLEDALPAALVVAQPDFGQRLVRVVLGDVLALPDIDRDLMLETIRAWLAADGSPSTTASTLYCHRNTVLNRLRRIEVLLGRSVETTATRVELALALTALDALPGQQPTRTAALDRRPAGQAPNSAIRASAAR
ncbi:MAG: PucR family transcriptional regulator [Pseudonocardiaceae bacterium]|nr:PucR family transcriptional regulator [Pseudonocardiaceae bacterium]